jgi:hypothetical protein
MTSSGLEEDDDAELTATLHESALTYFVEEGAENPPNAFEEPMVQGIQGSFASDIGQPPSSDGIFWAKMQPVSSFEY